jgi:hypothetical protein
MMIVDRAGYPKEAPPLYCMMCSYTPIVCHAKMIFNVLLKCLCPKEKSVVFVHLQQEFDVQLNHTNSLLDL